MPLLIGTAQPVRAAGLERFSQFLSSTQSARSDFEQKIVDRNGKLVQESRGNMAFSRPGKFRWIYSKPYAQLIVGDGSSVWIYDEELRQVTVRKLGQALSATPAALLAGNNDALKAFHLSEQGAKEGLEWIEAVPRDKEGGFEKVRIGFGFSGPEAMELMDSFGQTTVLRFTAFQRNPRLDPATFRFTPPPGVDVIGESK
ncbi:MAG: outer membrane lipoprotein chaperone LolA [Betaproteobacteria bacterium]|nr:outer membrane lipoprotein chaperone LolA [Betaproteobacteria bacterium]